LLGSENSNIPPPRHVFDFENTIDESLYLGIRKIWYDGRHKGAYKMWESIPVSKHHTMKSW